jgi:hypothetical protein
MCEPEEMIVPILIPQSSVADAHRDGGKRFIVRADEKLSAFVIGVLAS